MLFEASTPSPFLTLRETSGRERLLRSFTPSPSSALSAPAGVGAQHPSSPPAGGCGRQARAGPGVRGADSAGPRWAPRVVPSAPSPTCRRHSDQHSLEDWGAPCRPLGCRLHTGLPSEVLPPTALASLPPPDSELRLVSSGGRWDPGASRRGGWKLCEAASWVPVRAPNPGSRLKTAGSRILSGFPAA